ncbi:MAG: class I SAM-dependent methyltransferase [Hyphomicrobiales bacterium]|nr:class I SAM-dependent methyltransferase [Hyphomicrobiales bacterium]
MDERQIFLGGLAADACKRAEVLFRRNKPLEALDAFDRALDAVEGYEPAIRGATIIAERLTFTKHSLRLERLLKRCMLSPRGNPDALAATVGRLLQLKYRLSAESAWSGDATIPDTSLERLCDDILLMVYLSSTVNRNTTLEWFLILVRASLIRMISRGSAIRGWQNLAAALAAQVHNNEYIWPEAGDETGWLADAVSALDAAAWDPPDKRTVDLLLAYAMFGDPNELSGAHDRIGTADLDECIPAFRSLVERTVNEPARRAALEQSIPQLTAIDADSSRLVRTMYEANPYPRWLHFPVPAVRFDADQVLKQRFPHLGPLPSRDGPMQLLLPGVGTGRHAVWAASQYEDVDITAVDLSLRSLAYGRRMAERMGIASIAFMQGDILALEGQYDRIECIGVLHHLKDPEAGFRRLVSCLRPGGVIQVMVYAEGNRGDIHQLRTRLDGSGQAATTEEIRRIRERIVRPDGDLAAFASLTQRPDFHSTSGFRDLVLHVQESAFTMRRVRRMVESAALDFLGFEFTTGLVTQMLGDDRAPRLYRDAFPDDPTQANLANWERLEQDHRDLMRNYFFWCQKPAANV